MAKFWVFTACMSGLPLATRLKEEGNQVTLVMLRPEEKKGKWTPPKDAKEAKKQQERIDYLNKCGNGLVDKMWAAQAITKIRKNDYVIFDQLWGFNYGEALYRNGYKVLGGTKVGHTLESERQKTLNLLKKVGFDLPEQKKFGPKSSEAAIKFLESVNDEKLYVLKHDDGNVVTQCAEDTNDEIINKIQSEKSDIDSDGFLLQERVKGIEYNIETYYCKGSPVFCNIDLEQKQKYNSSSTVQVGCSNDLVWVLPLNHQLRELCNKPLDAFAKDYIHTGMLDVSVIHDHKENKIYALEVCGVRFGYNQIFTLFELLKVPMGKFFADFLDEKYSGDVKDKIFESEYSASLRVFNDGNSADNPISFPKEEEKHYWLWDVAKVGGKLLTVGGPDGESPGIITAHADSPEGAFAKIRELYDVMHLSTLWCNDQYQDDEDVGSVLYRFHSLRKLKFI